MMALAFQTNQTRVATLRMIKEASMRTYPSVNVDEAFHPLSHHGEDPDKQEQLVRVQAWHTERLAKFAQTLQSIKEGERQPARQLRSSCTAATWPTATCTTTTRLPQLLLGKGGGLKGDQHMSLPEGHAAREPAADHGPARRGEPREVRRLQRDADRHLTFDRSPAR